MRILIADDSIVSRHLLDATLRKWGYDVVIACDGTEAWNALQAEDAPKVAILDWVMPGLTGPEVCKRAREHAKDQDSDYTYILLLSSKSQREDLIEGMESGADDYLTKPFDQHELKVRLRAGTRIIDLQRELVAAREKLREQATKDFLTRVWNRSSVLEILQRELLRGARERRPVSVLLADLDRFKTINDTFGHFAGDAVLKEFARRMNGGEEFLIVLPGCDEANASAQGERLREALASDPVSFNETPYTVTASFGASTWLPDSSASAETVIATADMALYEAKNQGRNRVVFRSC
jgi:diguanylate cyclase (GGDEF)-like protein